jgi:2-polyprenyl-3-methyl-5-hydroxy-6-metoxy-1,4-benzoquinol methylase
VRSTGHRAEHWDAVYGARPHSLTSWHQDEPRVSLELIEALAIPHEARIIDVGGGTSELADRLILRGFTNVSVLDISARALETAGRGASIVLINDDVLTWRPARHFDCWHDRAVFHFMVDRDERRAYLATLRAALGPGGAIVMATFAEDGPTSCSGLPVARYSAEALCRAIGDDVRLVAKRREEHVTPRGAVQPFTWVAARIGHPGP